MAEAVFTVVIQGTVSSMELVQYFRILRRWFWLVALAAFVAGSVSFITRTTQAPRYQAESMIAVGGYLESPNPNSGEIRTGIDLAQTYAQIVRTRDVLQGVVDSLNLEFGTRQLNSMISTRILSGTSLLQISVTYTDPVLAADMANGLAQQLILSSPTNLTPEQQTQVDLLNEQIDTQVDELFTLRNRLREIDGQARTVESESVREDLLEERSILVTQINDASANIAQFTNTIASLQERTNSVEIVESADIPTNPIGSSIFSTVLLSAMVGASLAFGGVLVYEYVNDTIRNTDELTRTLNLPVLGAISSFGKKDAPYAERLVIHLPDSSHTTEEFRTLRTNLLYTSDKDNRVYVVSSASPQEGKSITTANLAASMALSGLKVLLIDADLRRPRQHEIFGLDNTIGLTTLLTGRTGEGETGQQYKAENWRQFVNKTIFNNMYVMTSGFTPQNPTELLGSAQMKRWSEYVRGIEQIDVVIFDSPPVLALSDSTVLAATMDAQVLLLIQAGKTRRSVALKAKERFDQINVEITGTVLNNVDLREEEYYGYNYMYYYAAEGNENS
jgi:capsular exopolysaccharide synthesis family protein